MEMHQIRYFLKAGETLNFTRAAEQCGVSVPSLSRGIRQLEDEQLENRDAVDRLTQSEETVRTLRHRLASTGQPDVAWTMQPAQEDVSRPDSFGELLRWLPRLAQIEFTGDPDRAVDLDDRDTLGAWAAKTWNASWEVKDGKVHVFGAYGSAYSPLRGRQPEDVAPVLLLRLVKAWLGR